MSEFHKKYIKNIKPYFESKDEDDKRLLNTINKFLKFNKLKEIRSGSNLLDLGSGTGSFVNICQKKGVIAKKSVIAQKSGVKLVFKSPIINFVLTNEIAPTNP